MSSLYWLNIGPYGYLPFRHNARCVSSSTRSTLRADVDVHLSDLPRGWRCTGTRLESVPLFISSSRPVSSRGSTSSSSSSHSSSLQVPAGASHQCETSNLETSFQHTTISPSIASTHKGNVIYLNMELSDGDGVETEEVLTSSPEALTCEVSTIHP